MVNGMMELGDKLPNGATFIAQRGDVVLAQWGKLFQVEYITWRVRGNYETETGNYFLDLLDAVENFYHRSR